MAWPRATIAFVTHIAFIGGTGPEGKGLAYRFALAGHEITIGSRKAERAAEAAIEVAGHASGATVRGVENADAAQNADLIVLTVPHTAQPASLPALNDLVNGKIVVSTGVPMEFAGGRASIVALPEGSAAEQAQALLPDARVIGAFQNLGSAKLWKDGSSLDQDVIVCGDEDEAKQTVMKLSEEIAGVRAVDGGVLANARYVEGITALLVSVNRNYKKTTGVRIAGL